MKIISGKQSWNSFNGASYLGGGVPITEFCSSLNVAFHVWLTASLISVRLERMVKEQWQYTDSIWYITSVVWHLGGFVPIKKQIIASDNGWSYLYAKLVSARDQKQLGLDQELM